MLAPRLAPLLTGLLLAFLALLGLQWVITSGTLAGVPLEYLVRDPRDDYVAVSYAVAEVKREPPSGVPVYVVGGSSAFEMVVSRETLQEELRAASGREVSVHMLAACMESFGQSLAIVDNLPPGPGVVVVTVAFNRFSTVPEVDVEQAGGKPFLMRSRALEDAIGARLDRRDPLVLLPGIADYMATYVRSAWQSLRRGDLPRVTYERHIFTPDMVFSDEEKGRVRDNLLEGGLPRIERHAADNAEMMARVIVAAQRSGYAVVVLEGPIDFDFLGDDWDPILTVYQPLCREVAAGHRVPYVDFSREIAIPSGDFADLTHLVDPGRKIWQPRLVDALAPIVRSVPADVDRDGGTASGVAP